MNKRQLDWISIKQLFRAAIIWCSPLLCAILIKLQAGDPITLDVLRGLVISFLLDTLRRAGTDYTVERR